jgi:hypothetical protein
MQNFDRGALNFLCKDGSEIGLWTHVLEETLKCNNVYTYSMQFLRGFNEKIGTK